MGEWITRLIEQMSYLGIALLMFLENLFPPIPSELIMPLAGYTAGKGEMSIVGVAVAGIVGTLAGALFWYAIARRVGEERLKAWAGKHGRWITLTPGDIDRVGCWFQRHHRWAVPVGHLIPGIRTLISIPAGFFKLPPWRFVALTLLGAGVWTSALAAAGYALGNNYETVDRYLGPVSTAIIGLIVLTYLWRVITFKRR